MRKVERAVIDILRSSAGEGTFQSDLVRQTGYSKSRVSEVLASLEANDLISRSYLGKNCKIIPSSGLINESKLKIRTGNFGRQHGERKRLKLGMIRASEYPFIIAFEKLLREEYEVQLEPIVYENGLNLSRDLSQFKIDLGIAPVITHFVFFSTGSPIKMLAPAGSGGASIFVRKTRTDRRYNLRVATTKLSTMELMLRSSIKRREISGHSSARYYQSPRRMIDSLLSGEVDAACVWEPYGTQLMRNRNVRRLARYEDEDGNNVCCALAAGNHLEPDFLERITGTFQESIDAFNRNPEEYYPAYSKLMRFDEKVTRVSAGEYGHPFVLDSGKLASQFEQAGVAIPSPGSVQDAVLKIN